MLKLIRMNIEEKLVQAISEIVKEKYDLTPESGTIMIEIPKDNSNGDYSTNIAMRLTKLLKRKPQEIAQELKEELLKKLDNVDNIEIAGPGFINFWMKKDALANVINTAINLKDDYGKSNAGKGVKVLEEYVSANPTGILHCGHARGAAWGDSSVRIMKAAGYNVTREYYINDAGNQMNNLAASVNARYLQLLALEEKGGVPEDLTVQSLDAMDLGVTFPENGYHGYDIIETAQRIIRIYGKEFVNMDEQERLVKFRTIAYQEKLAALKEDLADFRVEFDEWFSEQTLHDAGKIKESCLMLKEQGYVYEKDGALWLNSTQYGDDKDRVVIRDNGIPTYFAADIAYHRNKFERGFAHVINLWGADHHGYIARMKAAVKALGYEPEQLEVLLLQMVRLYRNGSMVKLSKRTGETVTIRELIDEVGVDAARYFFAMRAPSSHQDFDLTLAVEQSSNNPVYYSQYAHARLCSLLTLGEEIGIDANCPLLTTEKEKAILKQLASFPQIVDSSAKELAPYHITNYVHDLAELVHAWYNESKIVDKDNIELSRSRLALCEATKQVIKNALNLVGVSAPIRM